MNLAEMTDFAFDWVLAFWVCSKQHDDTIADVVNRQKDTK